MPRPAYNFTTSALGGDPLNPGLNDKFNETADYAEELTASLETGFTVLDEGGVVNDVGGVAGDFSVTAASVSYNGSTNIVASNVEAALDELDFKKSPTGHNHTAGDIASGVIATNRLGSGTADATHT